MSTFIGLPRVLLPIGTSTPAQLQSPIRKVFFFGAYEPFPTSGGSVTLRVLRRDQPRGAPFTVLIRNTGIVSATFSIQESADYGRSDPWSDVTFAIDGATATSVVIPPLGVAELIVDAATDLYLRFRASDYRVSGVIDVVYTDGSIDTGTPNDVDTIVDIGGHFAGVVLPTVTVTSSGFTEVARWRTIPGNDRSVVQLLVGGANALNGLRVSRAVMQGASAPLVTVAEDAGLAAIATAGGNYEIQSVIPGTPHTATSGTRIELAFNNAGTAQWVISARSAGTSTVTPSYDQ
jgi:hypothetical protein